MGANLTTPQLLKTITINGITLPITTAITTIVPVLSDGDLDASSLDIIPGQVVLLTGMGSYNELRQCQLKNNTKVLSRDLTATINGAWLAAALNNPDTAFYVQTHQNQYFKMNLTDGEATDIPYIEVTSLPTSIEQFDSTTVPVQDSILASDTMEQFQGDEAIYEYLLHQLRCHPNRTVEQVINGNDALKAEIERVAPSNKIEELF